jgi:hypothetical protein
MNYQKRSAEQAAGVRLDQNNKFTSRIPFNPEKKEMTDLYVSVISI